MVEKEREHLGAGIPNGEVSFLGTFDGKVGIHVVRVKYRRRPKAALKRVVPRIF